MSETSLVAAHPRRELIVRMEALQCAGLRMLFRAAPAAVADALGIQVMERGSGLYLACRTIPAIQCNKIMGLGLDGAIAPEQLDLAVHWLRDVCPPRTLLMIPPLDAMRDLPARLAERDLERSPIDVSVFHLADDKPAGMQRSCDLEIRAVSGDEAASFGQTICEGLGKPAAYAGWAAGIVGQPNITAYLAYEGATAVAGAALFTRKEWGWLFLAATKPAFRNRGAQSALLARRVADGRKAGIRSFSIEVLKPRRDQEDVFASYRNVLKAGFELAYERPSYIMAR